MSKKVIDITRRSEENKLPAKIEKPYRKPRGVPWRGGAVVVALCIAAGSAFVVPAAWGNASLQVRPESREVSVSKGVSASQGVSQRDQASLRIPALVLEKEEEGTRLFSSTGKAQKGEYAKGSIRVFNSASAPQGLLATTRFISEDGKLFKSQSRITVPAAKQGVPGFFDVAVTAAEPGEEYNISTSNFSLPGLAGSAAYTTVYGKSQQPMKGGTTKEIPVVTKEDIEKAKSQLLQSLQDSAEASLKNQLTPGYEISEQGFVAETLSTSSLVQEGAELSQFSSSARIRVRGFSFRSTDLQDILLGVLGTQVKETEELKQETVQMRYEVGNIDRASQIMVLDGFIQGRVYAKLDTEMLQSKIAGKERRDAERSLSETEGVLNHKLSLWPFWMTSVPQEKGRIRVQVQY